MEIKIYCKDVYGKSCAYVADKEQAEAIKLITGQRTLTGNVMAGLEQLGFTFTEILASTINK